MEFVNGLGLLALGSRLRALSERLYSLADEVYAKHGIAIQGRWFPALRLLHDRGPSTVGEIAEAIGQTHSAVSQMADKLVREGWLVSTPDAKDRRVRRVALSEKAHAALRDAKPAWRAIQEVLAERSAVAGIDVLGSLDQLAAILDGSLGDAIVARTTALRRAAVRVVPFAPELREHFYTLNAAWLTKYFYIEAIDERVLRNPEAELLAHGGAIFFAVLGEEVLGTCALMPESPGVYELTKMAVTERRQGLGLGRRLLDAVVAEYHRRGGKQLFLESHRRLQTALKLYESAGFEVQPGRKPDSHYQRSDVYMIYRERRGGRRRPASTGRGAQA